MMDKLHFSCPCEECVFCFFTYSLKFLKIIFLVEIDDLKKITNSLTVLCSEKQKQEKVRARVGWEMCCTDTGVQTRHLHGARSQSGSPTPFVLEEGRNVSAVVVLCL